MMKNRFRPFWSYDVIKTQKWLSRMSEKGYVLREVNFAFRIFKFTKEESENSKYMIIYDKGSNGVPANIVESIDYEDICCSKNYYVLKVINENSDFTPSYSLLLSKNQKLKYIVGSILLAMIIFYSFPVMFIFIGYMFGDVTFEYESGGVTAPDSTRELIEGIFASISMASYFFVQIWMVFTFFKLRITNKELSKLCGENLNLSFTIPKDTILSKDELRKLKKDNMLVKKTKIGWFYSPDKFETWLENMESKGFNLLRMSKIGNSFYFVKGKPKNMIYHVDYQRKNDATYFELNKESGWKLFFTSITRYFAISVWGQEYDQTPPAYYSDSESRIKHAKKFAFIYAVWLIPMGVFYFVLFFLSIYGYITVDYFQENSWMMITPIMFLVVGLEFLTFSYRIINYYYRVKKSA